MTYWSPPPWPSLSLLILVGPSSTREVSKSTISFQPKSPKIKSYKTTQVWSFLPFNLQPTPQNFLVNFFLFSPIFGFSHLCSPFKQWRWVGIASILLWRLRLGVMRFVVWDCNLVATEHEHHRNQIRTHELLDSTMSGFGLRWIWVVGFTLGCNGF